MAGMNMPWLQVGPKGGATSITLWGRYVTLADPDGNKLVLAGPPTR
jgi:hypothetical protein